MAVIWTNKKNFRLEIEKKIILESFVQTCEVHSQRYILMKQKTEVNSIDIVFARSHPY